MKIINQVSEWMQGNGDFANIENLCLRKNGCWGRLLPQRFIFPTCWKAKSCQINLRIV